MPRWIFHHSCFLSPWWGGEFTVCYGSRKLKSWEHRWQFNLLSWTHSKVTGYNNGKDKNKYLMSLLELTSFLLFLFSFFNDIFFQILAPHNEGKSSCIFYSSNHFLLNINYCIPVKWFHGKNHLKVGISIPNFEVEIWSICWFDLYRLVSVSQIILLTCNVHLLFQLEWLYSFLFCCCDKTL